MYITDCQMSEVYLCDMMDNKDITIPNQSHCSIMTDKVKKTKPTNDKFYSLTSNRRR